VPAITIEAASQVFETEDNSVRRLLNITANPPSGDRSDGGNIAVAKRNRQLKEILIDSITET
jgi:hypothetical protein